MIWAALAGGGIGVTAAGVMVWMALRLVKTQRALGDAELKTSISEAKRGLLVIDLDKAWADESAAVAAKDAALREVADRDAVIHELQDLLDECRDPVVVRARLADLLSGRPRLPH